MIQITVTRIRAGEGKIGGNSDERGCPKVLAPKKRVEQNNIMFHSLEKFYFSFFIQLNFIKLVIYLHATLHMATSSNDILTTK